MAIKKYKQAGKGIYGYGYLVPIGLILVSFYVIPIIMSFVLSFTKYNIMGAPAYIGLKNYSKLAMDKTFHRAIRNTIVFTIGVAPIQTILAMLIATWITEWKKNPLARIVQSAVFIPVISSMVLVSIVWRILLNGDASPLNLLMAWFGMSPNWLGSTKYTLFTLMGISIWKQVGYFIVLYIARIMNIPHEYYEASIVDGANKWQQFRYITVPQLKRTTIMVVFLGIIWSIQVFDLVYNLTGG